MELPDLSPLRDRVEAPIRIEHPRHPDVALWRPATTADASALAELQAAADRIDHPTWITPLPDIEELLGSSHLDLVRDSIVAVARDGRIIARGVNQLTPEPETIVKVILGGVVHPDFRGRGLGQVLLRWQRARAQQQLAASDRRLPGWIVQYVDERNVSGIRLAELLGFHAARYYATLSRDLAARLPEPVRLAGVTLAPWEPALSERARAAKNEAFADHWGTQPMSAEQWRGSVDDYPLFRPELSFLAVAGDEIVGLVTTMVNEDDFAVQGFSSSYVMMVATRRPWRGRGVAKALLGAVLEASKAAGFERVVLDVDTENPTGAYRLYESLGFAPAGDRQVAMILAY